MKAHVLAFVTAYNFTKHHKAIRWRTLFQAVYDAWTKDPAVFRINSHHLIPAPPRVVRAGKQCRRLRGPWVIFAPNTRRMRPMLVA